MTRWFPHPRLALVAAILVAGVTSSAVALAQDCGLKLSQFEAAAEAFEADTARMTKELSRLFDGFAKLESQMAADPLSCPPELTNSRAGVASFAEGIDEARSAQLLDCAFFFNALVLGDIEKARSQKDSQLVLRLGEVQRRIFTAEEIAVETSKQALFLDFRAQGLIEQHDILSNRCAVLSDAYE